MIPTDSAKGFLPFSFLINDKRLRFSVWNKASSELKSTVDHSKHQKMAAKASRPAAAAPSLFSRVTNFFGTSSAAPAEDNQRERSTISKPTAAKKSYGFAQSNLRYQTDTTSEHLYRLKNISADQLRSASPPREAERPPLALQPTVSLLVEKEEEKEEEEEEEEQK